MRALRCNTVYITCYRSMRVPVSICTSYFMADKKALVDSGATDNVTILTGRTPDSAVMTTRAGK
jgi:hypothetical protein